MVETSATQFSRVNILGVGVSAINMSMALEAIDYWIMERGAPRYVCVTGVHGVMESQRDESVRRIHNEAAMVTPDGMPLVWLSKLHGMRHVERVYGPDLMLAVCKQGCDRATVGRAYKHFLFGGAPDVPGKLAARLQTHFPNLQIVGAFSPSFHTLTKEEDEQNTQIINEAQPDIVWVGLSTPKQEQWMAAHVSQLNAPLVIGVGAAFDFHAGTKRQAPRWVQRRGLEWLFRLLNEPRRLWKRYLFNNPRFIFLTLLQILGLKCWEI